MKVLILSDIHGNLSALQSILAYIKPYHIDACVLLGDLIDYGMHSNETLQLLERLPYPCLCNIWGNHEYAIYTQDYSRFSSKRGQLCAQYTCTQLDIPSWKYLKDKMSQAGKEEFQLDGKQCLAIHGGLDDPFWGNITPGMDLEIYHGYDYVFSGHSHIPHFFESFFPADDPKHRNKKRTVFINPGSVGQPRNLCPLAQFAIVDTSSCGTTQLRIPYDIEWEQAAYTGQVDDFYKERLAYGI